MHSRDAFLSSIEVTSPVGLVRFDSVWFSLVSFSLAQFGVDLISEKNKQFLFESECDPWKSLAKKNLNLPEM